MIGDTVGDRAWSLAGSASGIVGKGNAQIRRRHCAILMITSSQHAAAKSGMAACEAVNRESGVVRNW